MAAAEPAAQTITSRLERSASRPHPRPPSRAATPLPITNGPSPASPAPPTSVAMATTNGGVRAETSSRDRATTNRRNGASSRNNAIARPVARPSTASS
jgi:hypothetical protein